MWCTIVFNQPYRRVIVIFIFITLLCFRLSAVMITLIGISPCKVICCLPMPLTVFIKVHLCGLRIYKVFFTNTLVIFCTSWQISVSQQSPSSYFVCLSVWLHGGNRQWCLTFTTQAGMGIDVSTVNRLHLSCGKEEVALINVPLGLAHIFHIAAANKDLRNDRCKPEWLTSRVIDEVVVTYRKSTLELQHKSDQRNEMKKKKRFETSWNLWLNATPLICRHFEAATLLQPFCVLAI